MKIIFDMLQRVERFLLAGSILGIAGLITLNVVARMFAGRSVAATGELCQFLVLVATLAGLSNAAGNGRHIRMTALHERFSPKARRRLLVVVSGSTALLLAAMAVYGLSYVAVVYRLGSVSPVLQVPLYLPYACVPLGFALASLQYILTAWKNLTSDVPHVAFDTPDEYANESESPL